MPNVVPLSKVDSVVDQAIARVVRGLALAKQRGIVVRMPKEIVFSINVCADDGINAIARAQTTSASTRRTSASEAAQEVVTIKGESTTTTESTQSGDSFQESSQQSMSSSDTQTNAHGRVTDTEIQYED